MIVCQICGQEFRSITNSHLLHKHGITTDEYVRLYGGQLISDETRKLTGLLSLGRKVESKYDCVEWDTIGLGSVPDSVIARKLGCSRRFVASQRKKKNIPPFVGIILTQEGTPCRSIYEAMYDAYLHWHQIAHDHEVRVADLPYIADFKMDGKYIEIVGMIQFGKYARKLELKKAAYKVRSLPVTWLSAKDVEKLYADCPVEIGFRSQRICERCGKETHDLVKNVCRVCYMDVWREEKGQTQVCKECGCEFSTADNRKYCSHSCYAASMEIDWPSWEWLAEQMQTTSIRQIARRIGVKETSLYMRISRRKQRNHGSLL
jgi:hypothetical protein